MNRVRKQTNLRLVANDFAVTPQLHVEENAMLTQSLNTEGRSVIVLMRASDLENRGAFSAFAKKYNPRCILDMRIAPRLDFFASTRVMAFKLFEDMHMDYFDFFGRIGVESKKNIVNFKDSVLEIIIMLRESTEEYDNRPFVLFFDSEELFIDCRKQLTSTLALQKNTSTVLAQYKSGLLLCSY